MDQNETPAHLQLENVPKDAPTSLALGEFVDVAAEERRQLLDYWHVILKRRWAVVLCASIVFATVAIWTLKQRPVFEGRVLVEINPEQPNVLNFQEILQLDNRNIESYRETQYKILQSRSLAERVVQGLQLYRLRDFYRGRALLGLIERDPAEIPSPSNPAPLDPAAEAFRNAVSNFQDSVVISPVRRSNLVEVAFHAYEPVLAARVANHLAAEYIDQNLQVRWDETVKASEWLSGRLVELKAKLEKSEDSLQAYARANRILFVEERKTLASTRLEQIQEEFTKAQAERFQKESLYRLVQADRVSDLPGFLSNRIVQDLAVRLSDVEQEYAELTAVVKPDYPKAVQLKRRMDALRESMEAHQAALTQNVVDEYQTALAREQYLAEALERQKEEVNDIAERSIQYNILKREVDTNRQLYEGLLQRLKEAQVSAGLKASNIRVVDSAQVRQKPVKPRLAVNLVLGMILGLGLGVGLAFFQEYLDNTLKTPDEVESLLRLPALGVLPRFSLNGAADSKEESLTVVPADQPAPPLAPGIQTDPSALEAFRSLRTSILLSASPVPKVILITSALPGEGKTTTTINLGATLASLGSRVVIVDCDMRRPACHRATGVANGSGFVRCLTGQTDLASAVQPVPGIPNLSLIPCGPIPPNPAELLSGSLAGTLIRTLRNEYDHVLVDSPPILSVADSRILATMVDAVVLVARAYDTPYEAVRRARSLIYGAGARILGVALNDVDFRRDGYGYDYYRHGYGYGYTSTPEGDSQENVTHEE